MVNQNLSYEKYLNLILKKIQLLPDAYLFRLKWYG